MLVAGGTGVTGRRFVPQLVARGHQVTATTTGAGKLRGGPTASLWTWLDAVSVGEAVAAARPDAIVNQMTPCRRRTPASPTCRRRTPQPGGTPRRPAAQHSAGTRGGGITGRAGEARGNHP